VKIDPEKLEVNAQIIAYATGAKKVNKSQNYNISVI
jgi:hypothetical protein